MNKNKIVSIINKILEDYILPLIYGIFICIALILLWAGLKIFVFGYFPVPTGSMQHSIIPGDVVFVNKLKLGPRTFRNYDFLDSDTIPVKNIRFRGYGKIERNDVIVFNYPYADSWSKARFNFKKFYVKRCLGIPGDTISIVNGFYKISGQDLKLGNISQQRRLAKTPLENITSTSTRADAKNGWTIKDFGPLYIPRKGDKLTLDDSNYEFYRRVVEWETGEKMSREDGVFYLNSEPIKTYTVANNYYFVAGDNIFNSRDSRYWGLLQEEYIVGASPFVLYSKDPHSGKFRWDRLLKSLDI